MIKKTLIKYKNLLIFILISVIMFGQKAKIEDNFGIISFYMNPVYIICLASLCFYMLKAATEENTELLYKSLLKNVNITLLTFLLILNVLPFIEELKSDITALRVFAMTAIPVMFVVVIKKVLSKIDKIGSQDKRLLFYSDSFSCKNIKQTFYHEIGHASIYALIDKKIDYKLKISIFNSKNRIFKTDYNGLAEAQFITKVDFMQKHTMQFSMLLCLAGKVSEETLLKSEGLGAMTDYYDWLEYAKTYLCAGHGGTYFIKPANKNEVLINKKSLDDLKEKQEKILKEFFLKNEIIFHEFYKENNDKKKINNIILDPFLIKLSLHENMTKIVD